MINIYQNKSTSKIIILVLAVLIAFTSLWYTNRLAIKIAKEEETQAKLWARAISKRANLVKLTANLFEKIGEDQREKIETWAEATSLIVKVNDVEAIHFLSKIIIGNHSIPVIQTDKDNKILSSRNIYFKENVPKNKYLDSLLHSSSFQTYKPVELNYSGGANYIYYTDSKIFEDLKQTLNDLTESFMAEIVDNSGALPVVMVDENKHLVNYGNMDSLKLSPKNLPKTIREMASENRPIELDLGDGSKRIIYYKNSLFLKQLKVFPYIQLLLFTILIIVAYYGFSNARNAEQNRIWVGMAKETAHQLGTPISSLSAWVDYLKEAPQEAINNKQLIDEIEKDVNRLTLIADRFSKIGSASELKPYNVKEVLSNNVSYMKKRSSEKVKFSLITKNEALQFKINTSLFNWVIENLMKNALDAMDGKGSLDIIISEEKSDIVIDVKDSGKGIPKNKFTTVFEPGYSTKKRGWGLGLSLTKRIIERYHNGKIFVKESSEKGSTIRIKLPKST